MDPILLKLTDSEDGIADDQAVWNQLNGTKNDDIESRNVITASFNPKKDYTYVLIIFLFKLVIVFGFQRGCCLFYFRKIDTIILRKSFLDALNAPEVEDNRISNNRKSKYTSLDAVRATDSMQKLAGDEQQRANLLTEKISTAFSLQVPAESLVNNFQKMITAYPPVDIENLAFRLFSDISWKLVMPELSEFKVEKASFDLDAFEAIVSVPKTFMKDTKILYSTHMDWLQYLVEIMLDLVRFLFVVCGTC